MATQNLVSASLSPEAKADIMAKLEDIRRQLAFLLSLNPGDIQGLFKAGNGYAPFLDKAYTAVSQHPGIMPAVFDVDEFRKDYALSRDLGAIVSQVNQLAEGLNNTMIAVNSDTMAGSLEVYAAVKQNRDKVPGLNVVAQEMGEFFKKAKKKEPAAV